MYRSRVLLHTRGTHKVTRRRASHPILETLQSSNHRLFNSQLTRVNHHRTSSMVVMRHQIPTNPQQTLVLTTPPLSLPLHNLTPPTLLLLNLILPIQSPRNPIPPPPIRILPHLLAQQENKHPLSRMDQHRAKLHHNPMEHRHEITLLHSHMDQQI